MLPVMPFNEVATFILSHFCKLGLVLLSPGERVSVLFVLFLSRQLPYSLSIRLITPITFIVRIKSFDPKTENDRGDQTGSGPGDAE